MFLLIARSPAFWKAGRQAFKISIKSAARKSCPQSDANEYYFYLGTIPTVVFDFICRVLASMTMETFY